MSTIRRLSAVLAVLLSFQSRVCAASRKPALIFSPPESGSFRMSDAPPDAPEPFVEGAVRSTAELAIERIEAFGIHRAKEAVTLDVPVAENYAPIGYYDGFAIRGFALDPATGYRRNGLTIAGEANMPLENKKRIRIYKGASGLEAGAASPGGVIDYETRRASKGRRLSIAIEGDGTGSRYAHVDAGARTVGTGVRLNAAAESMRPYVREAVGDRLFLSGVFDRRLTANLSAVVDLDWQRARQRSVPGYQVLGRAGVPRGVRPETMLNSQPWSEPVVNETANWGARLDYDLGGAGRLAAAFNENRNRLEDRVAFPYGCSSGPSYSATFCENGDYDLYDYRSPGERRIVRHARADWSGTFRRGRWAFAPRAGVSRLRRTVDRASEVYDYVGTANLYTPQPDFAPSKKTVGPRYRTQDYRDVSLSVGGAATLDGRWTLHAGLRRGAVLDRRASRTDGASLPGFSKTYWLPRVGLVWSPAGVFRPYVSYSEGLEAGGRAGSFTANAGEILDPKRARQLEAGAHADWSAGNTASAAVFEIVKPNEFIDAANRFVQRGRVVHRGMEAAFDAAVGERARVEAGIAVLSARQAGSGSAAFEGRTPLNVPLVRARAAGVADIPRLEGVSVDGAWNFEARKPATRDNAVFTPAFYRFDAGLGVVRSLWGRTVRWRFSVENVFDAVYWKDAGEAFGDGYLHLGAPRVYRLSMRVDFK